MNKNLIVVNFHPFSLMQDVLVYEDKECIYKTQVSVGRVANVVKGLKNQYNINSVSLIGNEDYLKRYAQELNTDFDITEIHIQEH